jgi:hypothetical protein
MSIKKKGSIPDGHGSFCSDNYLVIFLLLRILRFFPLCLVRIRILLLVITLLFLLFLLLLPFPSLLLLVLLFYLLDLVCHLRILFILCFLFRVDDGRAKPTILKMRRTDVEKILFFPPSCVSIISKYIIITSPSLYLRNQNLVICLFSYFVIRSDQHAR